MNITNENANTIIGKKLEQTTNVNFGTWYPVVHKRARNAKNPTIIGMVCAEDGAEGTENNGTVAWYI